MREYVVTWRDRKGQFRTTLVMSDSELEARRRVMNRRECYYLVKTREVSTNG